MRAWPARIAMLCVAALALTGGSALAGKKEKIAILGLEVLGSSSTIDAASTRVAQDLTVALRLHPKAGKGPYEWTPGSEKELVDEKIMNNCPTENKTCMAKIGSNLGADYLVYGRVERKSLGGQAGYQVTLKILKVATQTQTQTWTDFIPLDETTGQKLMNWANRGYRSLTHDFDGGTLRVVVKNDGFDRGLILIDGEERGNITGGSGEVTSLPEGRYRVSVVGTGYDRWDSDDKVTIHNGQTATEEVTLHKAAHADCDPMVSSECGGTISQGGNGKTKWKVGLVTGLVAGAVGGVLWYYSFRQLGKAKDCDTDAERMTNSCGDFADAAAAVSDAKSWSTRSFIGGGVAVVGALLAGVSIYELVHSGGTERMALTSRHRDRDFAVIPTVTDRSAGATLLLHW